MTVTPKLLELFRADKQVRGLRSRFDAAEKFHATQQAQLDQLSKRAATMAAEAKALRAAWKTDEGEAKRIDARVEHLREQMNSASTAKEYAAFQAELTTLKEQKSLAEDKVLEAMTRAEAIEQELQQITAQQEERKKIVAGARSERDGRAAEIKDRLDELTAQRKALAAQVPADVLRQFEELVRIRGDEAMAPVEVVDRRSYEYSCASCMMTLPMETVNSIVRGHLTRCVNCQCLLYTEDTDIVRPKPVAKARG